MEEIYKKELGAMKWIARLTERLTIITTSLRIKQDLGITEEDNEIIRALCGLREVGPLLMYENVTVKKEDNSQSVTQTNLFNEDVSTTAQVDCLGIDVDNTTIETKNKKK